MASSHPVAGGGVENEDRESGRADRDHGEIEHPVGLLGANVSALESAGLDLAGGQKQGRLAEQQHRAETIQNDIQHDPSPWRLRPQPEVRPGVQVSAINLVEIPVGLPWGTAAVVIRIP